MSSGSYDKYVLPVLFCFLCIPCMDIIQKALTSYNFVTLYTIFEVVSFVLFYLSVILNVDFGFQNKIHVH